MIAIQFYRSVDEDILRLILRFAVNHIIHLALEVAQNRSFN